MYGSGTGSLSSPVTGNDGHRPLGSDESRAQNPETRHPVEMGTDTDRARGDGQIDSAAARLEAHCTDTSVKRAEDKFPGQTVLHFPRLNLQSAGGHSG